MSSALSSLKGLDLLMDGALPSHEWLGYFQRRTRAGGSVRHSPLTSPARRGSVLRKRLTKLTNASMKTCSYCGAKYPDDTPECPIDHTAISPRPTAAAPDSPPAASEPNSPPARHSQRAAFEFSPLTPEQRQQDLVTLVTCGTLTSADLVVCKLRAAGVEAFIPDKFLMQTVGFNFNTFGYVRVQVAPKDYDTAKAVLSGKFK